MDVNVTIIGAGAVGLAIGERLSGESQGVFIIEKHHSFGQETSSRSSEVIHAGIYYPEGSLKAKLCVKGKEMLYGYCRRYEVPFNKCGKLIVATAEDEIPIIEGVIQTAERNGVNDLEMLNRHEVGEMEPNIFALKAAFSPSTGIIDSHSLMKQYETNTLKNGAQIVYGSEVTGIEKIDGGYRITLRDSQDVSDSFTSRIIVNSAGLTSDKVSGMLGMQDENLKILFCKGEYFRVNPPKNKLVKKLIYPVPHPYLEHIGVHVTVDLAGGVKLGPDFKYLEKNEYDYSVTPDNQGQFYESAKKYLPFLEYEDLSPDMAGIRPKIQKPGHPFMDFYIREESERGFPGFINLIGMESPALTASLAIAEHVALLIT